MSNNTNLEEKALEVLATYFHNAGYRKGIVHGIVGCCAGMAFGMAASILAYIKAEGCGEKTEKEK